MIELNANETFRKKLLQLITESNISMRELSNCIDASPCYIQKVIEGKFTPSMKRIFDIANYFQIPAINLFIDADSTIAEINSYLIQMDKDNQEIMLHLAKELVHKKK